MTPDLPSILAALIAGTGLLFVMRWVFAPARGRAARRARTAPLRATGDLGLLAPLELGVVRARANATRANLGDAGIRSSLSVRRDGRVDVLVFRDDLDRARALLPPGSSPS
jgi:hypothetical protein